MQLPKMPSITQILKVGTVVVATAAVVVVVVVVVVPVVAAASLVVVLIRPRLALQGEILQRHESDVHSEDDDGLSREEKLLSYIPNQLKKMMDFSLATGTLRSPQGSMRSSSMDDSLPLPHDLDTSTSSATSAAATEDHVQHLEVSGL